MHWRVGMTAAAGSLEVIWVSVSSPGQHLLLQLALKTGSPHVRRHIPRRGIPALHARMVSVKT